jgi:hypothetical protein
MPRRRALAWGLASGVVSVLDVGACVGGRALNALQADDTRWIVAQYRSPQVWVALFVVNAAVWAWLARVARHDQAGVKPLTWHALSMLAFSLPLGLELGMGVSYQQVSGELRIGALVLTRTRLQFPSTPDGVCLEADLSDPWTWRLNEQRVRTKLLPLPLDDARLRARLRRPGECPR